MQRVLSFTLAALAAASAASAAVVPGGGSSTTDCALVLDVPGANKPAPPKAPRSVDCIDGDDTCDDDGLRNGQCVFTIRFCANSTAVAGCTPDTVNDVVVEHAIDDGSDPRFDNDFLALQTRADALGLPTASTDDCTLDSAITVRLRGPDSSSRMKKNRKTLRVDTAAVTGGGSSVTDVDKMKFTCRPEGDGVYDVTDLYTGTFDRIRQQVFAQSCATSACHDSESSQGGLILLPGAAYGNIVNVAPTNAAAAGDMLSRIAPGDPAASFLYRKLTGDLEAGYGSPMPLGGQPLDPALVEVIRLWILGDGVLGPAPETGWVVGTDQ